MTAAVEALVDGAPRVGWLLAGGFGAIVAAERGRMAALARSTLFLRWRTWVVVAVLAGAAVWSRAAAVVLVGAAGVQAARELARLGALPLPVRRALIGVAVLSPALLAFAPDRCATAVPLLLLVVALASLPGDPAVNGRALAFGVLAAWFGPVLLGHLILLRDAAGPGALLAVVAATACSDVAAFAVGKAVGGRPLAARLSPGKTRAGVAGNLLGAALGLLLFAPLVPALSPLRAVLLAGAIGAGAVLGDLLESLLKRHGGVKDTGAWLPGFGGLLDRVDSLLLTAPLALAVLA